MRDKMLYKYVIVIKQIETNKLLLICCYWYFVTCKNFNKNSSTNSVCSYSVIQKNNIHKKYIQNIYNIYKKETY